ncbi:hypothetical protein [Bacillus benzoevorans]|uniref:Uncharacterized protein n=1 Tax=Bacillus benzoevorans TaxID=1456 RepID=A0A7X0HTJ8_9BACI|nr:hypothetical protein [Bacillus benzoevorans]MBB6445637.1 hypothetical protein [Bacillus benzoevorans]
MNTEIRDSELYLLEELIEDLNVKKAEYEKKFNSVNPENKNEMYKAYGKLTALLDIQTFLIRKKREIRKRYKELV